MVGVLRCPGVLVFGEPHEATSAAPVEVLASSIVERNIAGHVSVEIHLGAATGRISRRLPPSDGRSEARRGRRGASHEEITIVGADSQIICCDDAVRNANATTLLVSARYKSIHVGGPEVQRRDRVRVAQASRARVIEANKV